MEESKIVIISNRGVRPNRSGETLFKNQLTKSSHRLRCAEVNPGGHKKKYSLALVEEGQEQAFLNTTVTESNGRPWVFFVHGNNQTLHKNLKKCFALRKTYNVNVLAFSWPSVHHGKIRNLLNYIPVQPRIGKYLTKQIKRKLKQYKKARHNAKLSAPDLSTSLSMFSSALAISNSSANFVCHSLGHRVLKLSHQHSPLSTALQPYSNVLLHQADEDNDDHRDWIDEIGKGEQVFITTNEKDKVLELSNIYNHKTLKNQRLGNVAKSTTNGSPVYKDFTGMKKLGFSGHTMFILDKRDNTTTHAFFNPIITG